MKKVLLLTSLAFVMSSASAQSSVTLYGIVDAGFTFNSNAQGNRQYSFGSGTSSPNRWGVTGREDLGGGYAAVFTLEGGFNVGTGAMGENGTEFGRTAIVGINSPYGLVTLGRQIAGSYFATGAMTAGGDWAASGAGYGAHPGDVDNMDTFNRIANSIQFKTPNYRGFTLTGTYGFGGKPGAFSQNSIWDVGASYESGPLRLAAGYLFVKDPNFSFWGNKANDSATGNNIGGPVSGGYATANSEQVVSAGVTYKLASATFGLVYSNAQYQRLNTVAVSGLNAAQNAFTGTARFDTGEFNVKYAFSPDLTFGAAYIYTRNSGADGYGTAHYQQVDLGAIYSLSKRTSLYAVAVWQHASGQDSTGGHAVAAIAGASPSDSNHQVVATFGVAHMF